MVLVALGLAVVMSSQEEVTGKAQMIQEAKALKSVFSSSLSEKFLGAVSKLPSPKDRKVWFDEKSRKFYNDEQFKELDDPKAGPFREVPLNDQLYYFTKYGTPLAYTRVVQLLAEHGVNDFSRKKVLDFGYGTVGQLRLMAELGAEAVGVDVDPFLTAIYSAPSDQGKVGPGRVRLIDGFFPTDAKTVASIGTGYDVFTSKNTLKRGYIHPAETVDPRLLVNLGVSDEEFLKSVHTLLKPGGLVVIYNIAPKQTTPYKPYADGRNPFAKETWEAAGFEVLTYDTDDNAMTRKMAKALKWDEVPNKMDLENDLFGHFSVFRKKG